MARAIDRSNPAHAEAVLAALVPDANRREAIVRALAQVAEIAAELHPASWSITLQPNLIQLNVGQILVFQIGRDKVTLAGHADAMDDSPLRDAVEKSEGFAVMPGVLLFRTPHTSDLLGPTIQVLLPHCLKVTRDAARSRGPWRRAHSPGVVPLLERSLGHSLAWEAPTEVRTAEATAPDLQAVERTIVEARSIPAARLARRSQAIDQARRLIIEKFGAFKEPDLRRLLQLFNHDWTAGREVLGRFSAGLVGNNANLLVGQIGTVNTVVPQLWHASDTWIAEHIAELRHGGTLPGGGWLFPTMILHTRDPSRFFPMTRSMAEGLAVLDGGSVVSLREGSGYLDYCQRVRKLLSAHDISPHGADILLWHGATLTGLDPETGPDEPANAPPNPAPSANVTHATPTVADILGAKVQPSPEHRLASQAPAQVIATSTDQAATPTATGEAASVAERPHITAQPATEQPASQPPAATSQPPAVTSDDRAEPPAARRPASQPPPGPPAATSDTPSIGWLHLTDLHQGMSGSSWLWPNVRAMLFDDLTRLHDASGPWDLVFFTGDLTQRGTAQEFAELDRTLDHLWKRLERLGSHPALIAVPGNHDLARPDPLDPVVLALSLWHTNRALRDHVLGNADNPYIARLRQAFAAYTEWAERAPWFVREGVTRGLMPGDMAVSLKLHGLEVGVVALNSAFLQLTSANFHEKLDVDARQLHQVCGHYAPDWLQDHHVNLLLTHHSPDWLEPRARQEFRNEIDDAGRFAAHFFGHMHEGSMTSTSHGGGRARHAIQGASLFGLEEHDGPTGRGVARSHGYSAGRFERVAEGGASDRVRVRLFPRRMFASAGGRRIAPDVSAYDLDERGSFSYLVPTSRRR